jgi:4-hydroxy-3-methylbut-2-en-1-yl diphosphate reductase
MTVAFSDKSSVKPRTFGELLAPDCFFLDYASLALPPPRPWPLVPCPSMIGPMRVILAAPRGFCAGVNMAIEALETAIKTYGTPLWVYHEIVHNRWVVERFRREGVVFVSNLADVPPEAMLLYSAHGVPPEVRRQADERGLKTIDATCPLVTKVHLEAVQFAQQGFTVLLIGHAGHDEVIGTMGETPESIRLVETVEDVKSLDVPDPSRVAYLTQTTLSVDDAARIIERLRQRFPRLVGPTQNDICYATQNRQEAVRRLAQQADIVLVVGSPNSSNSRRLAELALACGVESRMIDGPADIDLGWFSGVETVLITAGASAPESLVQKCVGLLQERFAASVETQVIREEKLRFALPKPLRKEP